MTTTRPETVRVTDTSTRSEIAAAIGALMVKMRRLPRHFVDDRQAIADEIDLLVDRWLLAEVA